MGSTLLPSAGTVISYKGGDIKVFADDSNPSGGLRLSDPVVDPTTLTLANTSNGLLFLELLLLASVPPPLVVYFSIC